MSNRLPSSLSNSFPKWTDIFPSHKERKPSYRDVSAHNQMLQSHDIFSRQTDVRLEKLTPSHCFVFVSLLIHKQQQQKSLWEAKRKKKKNQCLKCEKRRQHRGKKEKPSKSKLQRSITEKKTLLRFIFHWDRTKPCWNLKRNRGAPVAERAFLTASWRRRSAFSPSSEFPIRVLSEK